MAPARRSLERGIASPDRVPTSVGRERVTSLRPSVSGRPRRRSLTAPRSRRRCPSRAGHASRSAPRPARATPLGLTVDRELADERALIRHRHRRSGRRVCAPASGPSTSAPSSGRGFRPRRSPGSRTSSATTPRRTSSGSPPTRGSVDRLKACVLIRRDPPLELPHAARARCSGTDTGRRVPGSIRTSVWVPVTISSSSAAGRRPTRT